MQVQTVISCIYMRDLFLIAIIIYNTIDFARVFATTIIVFLSLSDILLMPFHCYVDHMFLPLSKQRGLCLGSRGRWTLLRSGCRSCPG